MARNLYLFSQSMTTAEKALRAVVNREGGASQCVVDFIGDEWRHFCAAMDVLGDTAIAIESAERLYLSPVPLPSPGFAYLSVYGLLQSFILHQDSIRAIEHCAKSRPQIKQSSTWKEVRVFRQRVAGHPLRPDGNTKSNTQWGVMRGSVDDPTRFQSYSWGDRLRGLEIHETDLLDLIRRFSRDSRHATIQAAMHIKACAYASSSY